MPLLENVDHVVLLTVSLVTRYSNAESTSANPAVIVSSTTVKLHAMKSSSRLASGITSSRLAVTGRRTTAVSASERIKSRSDG